MQIVYYSSTACFNRRNNSHDNTPSTLAELEAVRSEISNSPSPQPRTHTLGQAHVTYSNSCYCACYVYSCYVDQARPQDAFNICLVNNDGAKKVAK